jgi:hypothetical protein
MNVKGPVRRRRPLCFGCAYDGQAAAYLHLQLHLQFPRGDAENVAMAAGQGDGPEGLKPAPLAVSARKFACFSKDD